ncbi:MAG TPA: ATP-binding protein, partial [Chloroflexota bacterium]|nr:ATP-binding protein [Chloroflexota bacterium]
VHEALERFWSAIDRASSGALTPPDASWRAEFETAVGEIAGNIMRHAHPPGAAQGSFRLRLRGFASAVEADFADHGVPYAGDLAAVPRAPTNPQDVMSLPEGGYGLALTLAVVDRLEYSRTGAGVNRWRLVKLIRVGDATRRT